MNTHCREATKVKRTTYSERFLLRLLTEKREKELEELEEFKKK